MYPLNHRASHRTLRRHQMPLKLISMLQRANDKRRFYRVADHENPPLWVGVWGHDGTACVGQCTDASFGGAGVRFPLHQDPKLQIGQVIALSFQSSTRPGAMQATATVTSVRALSTNEVRYGFQFADPNEIVKNLVPSWAQYFNRRHLVRISPNLGRTMWADIRWTRGQAQGRVVDLSVGGLGIAVPNTRLNELTNGVVVYVSMQLPEETEPMRVRAIVRSNRALLGTTRVGFEFAADGGIDRYREALQRCLEARCDTDGP
jgi:c-di-GMP-binding flagellar brake protein YcgR